MTGIVSGNIESINETGDCIGTHLTGYLVHKSLIVFVMPMAQLQMVLGIFWGENFVFHLRKLVHLLELPH